MSRLFTIDFETYYDQQYSLTKMLTEEYVADPRFDIMLVSIKCDNHKPKWVTGNKAFIGKLLRSLELEKHGVLGHNTMFDGLILAHHFGIYPGFYFDTRLMAQAKFKPFVRSVSLKSCLEYVNLGIKKGTEVQNMLGRPRASLSPAEMKAYGEYSNDDTEGEYRLFQHLLKDYPRNELKLIDLTLRMYLQPQLQLDPKELAQCHQLALNEQQDKLNKLPAGVNKDDLMSNPKFAEALKRFGVDPPIKISPQTGNTTWAFAKTDPGWKELEEEWEDHPEVGPMIAARVAAKSTLAATRSERLLKIANQFKHFRVPLLYYGAHTGRLSGMEKINAQNFPRVDKSRMRFGVRAPKGYVVLAADLAQIEARVTAWLAGQQNLLEGFRRREDIYSDFATTAYGVETVKDRSPEDKHRRFIGKTCVLGLGYGMSDARLKATLRKDNVKLSIAECMRLVSVYRTKYGMIPQLWRKFDAYLETMATGQGRAVIGPCTLGHRKITLPNGMDLAYHNLIYRSTDKYTGWTYDFAGETRTLWGGKVTENVVQALARIIVMDNMIAIHKLTGYKAALQQHDELDYVVRESEADAFAAEVTREMRKPPSWALDLPVEVEVNYGPTLGHCK